MMKWFRGVSFLLLLLFFTAAGTNVFAMNTGCSTEELTSEERNHVLSHMIVRVIKEEPDKGLINCFDVNKDGMIAIGLETAAASEKHTICVYSNSGIFQYGYTFEDEGDYGIEWDGNNIIIFFYRGDLIVAVSPEGEILECLRAQDTVENNSYLNQHIRANKRSIEGTEYILKNRYKLMTILSPHYSQLVAIKSTGEKSVLYDASELQLYRIIVGGLIFLFVFLLCTAIAWYNKLSGKKKNA